jgi:hypothetical protein
MTIGSAVFLIFIILLLFPFLPLPVRRTKEYYVVERAELGQECRELIPSMKDATELNEIKARLVKAKCVYEGDSANFYYEGYESPIATRHFTVLEDVNAAKLLFDRLESFPPGAPWAVTTNHLWAVRATGIHKVAKSIVSQSNVRVRLASTDYKFVLEQWHASAAKVEQ